MVVDESIIKLSFYEILLKFALNTNQSIDQHALKKEGINVTIKCKSEFWSFSSFIIFNNKANI
jgi:hypothetical protein